MSCSCTLEDYLATFLSTRGSNRVAVRGMVIFSRVLPTWIAIQQISLGIRASKGATRFLSNFSIVGSLRSAFWTGKLVDFQLKLVFFTFKLGEIGRFSPWRTFTCHSVAASSFKHLNDEIPGRLLVALRSKDFSGSRMMTSRTMG